MAVADAHRATHEHDLADEVLDGGVQPKQHGDVGEAPRRDDGHLAVAAHRARAVVSDTLEHLRDSRLLGGGAFREGRVQRFVHGESVELV